MSSDDRLEAVEENREDLEALTESDLRCAKYAQALPDAADETDTGTR